MEDYLYDLDSALDLPMEAAHALTRGLDSRALAELAGQPRDAAYEVRELVPSVIEELALDLAPLPEAVFTRARETASAYLSGSLRFPLAAMRLTQLLLDEEYLSFDNRPEAAYPECEHLWLLNEWLEAVSLGYSDTSGYLFESSEAAERYFGGLARAITDDNANR